MPMNIRDYFRLRCSEMLVMERDIWKMNQLMAGEVENQQIKEAFHRHGDPTRKQISTLEQIVDRLGGIMGPEENPITRGMMRAHQEFMDMNPPQSLIDLNDAMEGDKIEHLEMASYGGLITLARHLGENEFATMLEQNRTGEKRMCTVLEGELPRLLQTHPGEPRQAA